MTVEKMELSTTLIPKIAILGLLQKANVIAKGHLNGIAGKISTDENYKSLRYVFPRICPTAASSL